VQKTSSLTNTTEEDLSEVTSSLDSEEEPLQKRRFVEQKNNFDGDFQNEHQEQQKTDEKVVQKHKEIIQLHREKEEEEEEEIVCGEFYVPVEGKIGFKKLNEVGEEKKKPDEEIIQKIEKAKEIAKEIEAKYPTISPVTVENLSTKVHQVHQTIASKVLKKLEVKYPEYVPYVERIVFHPSFPRANFTTFLLWIIITCFQGLHASLPGLVWSIIFSICSVALRPAENGQFVITWGFLNHYFPPSFAEQVTLTSRIALFCATMLFVTALFFTTVAIVPFFDLNISTSILIIFVDTFLCYRAEKLPPTLNPNKLH